ncbi:BZ3500_MvSof-1268-A1-R1_Chr1-3g01614 [Microbotryum saponariae]|uniref:BZ3500_MvSof-1268-A1-R1_Chr1-3g01614 protein n=1 Tax=Microbotryum saponariae TaxID=289078 RepID=A0A2X0MP29_9BASI|nr:BZ3500_MvSof-1268-A1-R1_Chr1-3g01614 [Microbotryum saponariae]SCZ94144.1 BZ3501_MvSof-1269-A2-R1_Chr1-3g01215 [Microbotryum saponariae]
MTPLSTSLVIVGVLVHGVVGSLRYEPDGRVNYLFSTGAPDSRCKDGQYFSTSSNRCLECSGKFRNSLRCTEDEALSCDYGYLDNGNCVRRTVCLGAYYVSPRDGASCVPCPDRNAASCDAFGTSITCSYGAETAGVCRAVPCPSGKIVAQNGRACFRRLESEDGPASQRVLFNCRKGMRMLDGTCVNCPTSSDGTACCTDPFATSCSEVDTSLTCRKGYGLPAESSRTCLQQYTLSRFGSEGRRFRPLIGHGKLGLGQSFETAYVIPSTTYTKCIAFSRIASERIAYYSTATKSCVLQRISTFDPTTLTHAPSGFSLSVLGGCQDASKRSPGKEALRLGARCIEQIFYIGQNGQRGKPSGY